MRLNVHTQLPLPFQPWRSASYLPTEGDRSCLLGLQTPAMFSSTSHIPHLFPSLSRAHLRQIP